MLRYKHVRDPVPGEMPNYGPRERELSRFGPPDAATVRKQLVTKRLKKMTVTLPKVNLPEVGDA